jgi:hypothetical protein
MSRKIEEIPPLTVEFRYHPGSGHYEATLSNGTSFLVTTSHLGGKLEYNLALYRDAVRSALGHDIETKRAPLPTAAPYPEEMVRKFDGKGKLSLTLDDLDLEF